MREVLFVEPSAFLALNDKKDPNYKRTVEFVRGLFATTQKITTSFLAVAEAASSLNEKLGYEKTTEFLGHFKKGGVDVLGENEIIRSKAEEIFERFGAKIKGLSLFECMYVATMHYFGIHRIFSFNKNFDKLEVIRVPKEKKESEK